MNSVSTNDCFCCPVISGTNLGIMDAIFFASIFPVLYYLIEKRIEMARVAKERRNSVTKLDEDLWALLSRYTRLKAADWKGFVYCFTCPKYENWKLVDAGHYIPKATSGSYLKFYERNIHVQCQECNRLKGGNYKVYKQKLIAKYGDDIISELNALRSKPPLTVSEYKEKIKHYKQLLKPLSLR